MARAVRKTKPIHTLWLSTANTAAVELAKLHGFDGLCLDLEHGAFDREATDRLVAMARGIGA